MKDTLYDVINAIRISKNSFRRIKINFVWAFLYNVLLIPIAMGSLYPAGVHLDPMYAGAAMAMSSISVVISSLLLKRYSPTYSLKDPITKENIEFNDINHSDDFE
jgi:Cu+-exporting ATPase